MGVSEHTNHPTPPTPDRMPELTWPIPRPVIWDSDIQIKMVGKLSPSTWPMRTIQVGAGGKEEAPTA